MELQLLVLPNTQVSGRSDDEFSLDRPPNGALDAQARLEHLRPIPSPYLQEDLWSDLHSCQTYHAAFLQLFQHHLEDYLLQDLWTTAGNGLHLQPWVGVILEHIYKSFH